MKTILVPLDGSPLAETVLPIVSELACDGRCRVMLLSVWEVTPEEAAVVGDEHVRKLREQGVKSFKAYLTNVADRLTERGLDVSSKVVSGHPAAEILAASAELKPDIVAMASKGRGGEESFGRRGNVAEKVLRASALPVLVLGPRLLEKGSFGDVALRSILVPLDGSAASEAALPTAMELARGREAEISLLRVVPPLATPAPGVQEKETPPELEEKRREAAIAYLEDVQERFGEPAWASFVEVGDARREIAAFVEREGVDLVVLASRSRYDAELWRLGGVADAVIESAAPVLLVPPQKPRG
jgi:nucleotide-binding universal stress UspA family protein